MGVEHPALLLLALPAAWVWWATRDRGRVTNALRLAALALLVAALASPYLRGSAEGRDLIVVVDRSRSMPAGAEESALELLRLAEQARAEGDRLAVVTFGADVALERELSASARVHALERPVDRDGSDLADALDTALELIPEGRRAGLLLLSDGEHQGRDPLDAARRAFGRGVRIDVRPYRREGGNDLAVERLSLPESVDAGEPFQFSVWVRSDARVDGRFVLERDGEVLARGERAFREGSTRLVFRDRVEAPGVARYHVRIEGADDRVPENDRALGALRVEGPRGVLVLNVDGAASSLVRALRGAGLPVEARAARRAAIDRAGLEAFRAVVLENVPAGDVDGGLVPIARFVTERGGGLLLTGGKASFGVGGYHLSPVDELLPVSMEMREEQRKQGLALAVALDRSGSMGTHVASGRTKMMLANDGTCAAVELLARIDSVAVIAVDTDAHVVQPLAPAEDVDGIVARVRGIGVGGGGIYVRTALEAALAELRDAPQQNRHVVLFADAADAEEQEGCEELVADMTAAGWSLSVIALGTPADPDAVFLQGLAALGGGEAYFTTSADELPRLFAQDTLNAARATFVEEPTGVRTLADVHGLGELGALELPRLDGYNLTWLRPSATAAAVTTDELGAPVLAYAYRGAGRVAAYTGQVGGTFGAPLVAWDGFAELFVTLARWLAGRDETHGVFATVRREGREAVVRAEAERDDVEPTSLTAELGLPDGRLLSLPLERVGEGVFEARFPLERSGIALPAVRLDERRLLPLAPVALPYSPEFEPSADPERGERLLRTIARESGGEVAPLASSLFRGERGSRSWRSFERELALAALLVLLLEVAGRRLALWADLPRPSLRGLRRALRGPGARGAQVAQRAETVGEAPKAREDGAPVARKEEAAPDLGDALQRARRAARRELKR